MTLTVREAGDLDDVANKIVDEMFSRMVRELRAHYGKSVPTDDRLADVEIRVRNFIHQHMPEARAEKPR